MDLFKDNTNPVVDPNKDYLEELVGEGKPYKDQTALARALMEKEAFIQTLKREKEGVLSDLEERTRELKARTQLEEIVDKINSPSSTQQSTENNQNRQSASDPAVSVDDIVRKVTENISVQRKTEQEEVNFKAVVNRLTEEFGDSFPNKLDQLSKDLGVGKDFLNSVAKTNPKAFFKLVGLEDKPQSVEPSFSAAPPRGALVGTPNPTTRNWAFFEKMRREQPSVYWSGKVQAEIHQRGHEAALKGLDFTKL